MRAKRAKIFFVKDFLFWGEYLPPQNGLGGVNTPPKIVGGAYGTPKIVWGCQMAHYPPPWTPMK